MYELRAATLSQAMTPDSMKNFVPILAATMTALWLAGCRTAPVPFHPQESAKYSIESTGKFVVLDQPTPDAVICTGLQERRNSEGRLEVVANVKNQQDRRIEVQVRCVFKDVNGFSTGDETPWQTLSLGEIATEAVHYTAANGLAHKFTIAVRTGR
jgi:uncharacterized protein YcfL